MTNEEKKEIGKRIQRRRKELRLTQKELAERVHKVEGSIRQYENGLRMPDETTKVAIANALGVSYADLFIDQTPETFDSPEDFKKRWDEITKNNREAPGRPGIKTSIDSDGNITNEIVTQHLDVTDLSVVEREELENYKEYLIYKRSKNS